MSTSNPSSTFTNIPFTYTHPQQPLRLLELSPELLSHITASKALSIKSPSSSRTDAITTADDDAGHINLVTETQTFVVRQVNSSNSVFVVRPHVNETSGKEEGVTAFSTVPATLETQLISDLSGVKRLFDAGGSEGKVVPIPDAVQQLTSRLSVIHSLSEITPKNSQLDRVALSRDIPFSQAELDLAWIWLCAFEAEGKCYRPSSRLRLQTWKRVLDAATIGDVDLGQQFLVRDLWKSVLGDDSEESEGEKELFEAIVRRVSVGVDEGSASDSDDWISLSPKLVVAFAGEACLQEMALTSDTAVLFTRFQSSWQDLLPEKWRNDAKKEALMPGSFAMTEDNRIHGIDRTATTTGATTGAGTKSASARKWHERFKNTRR